MSIYFQKVLGQSVILVITTGDRLNFKREILSIPTRSHSDRFPPPKGGCDANLKNGGS